MSTSRETATLAGGCFWCLEAVFQPLKGVDQVESGYSGGTVPNPSYEQVCTGATGHAEVVQVTFDPAVISYRELLEPNVITPGSTSSDTLLPADGAAPLVVERLSTREREVLAHAAGMLSTAELAAEMYLSVNTVKTHLRSIYRKLSATHRSEAVRRARQLGLI